MSWIYKGNKITTQAERDTSTKGRWTFNREYYFQPSEYQNWSKNKQVNTYSYSAQLITNQNVPSAGTICQIAGLGSFYVNEILSVQNMNKEDNPDATSWARVIVEYQNTPDAIGSSSADSGIKKPWQQNVQDFSVILQAQSRPMLSGYNIDNNWNAQELKTKAGQKLYNVQTPYYYYKATWTLNDRANNYASKFDKPYLNQYEITLFDKITIPAGHGLIMPPGYRQLYYNAGTSSQKIYDQWTFEVIIDPLNIPGAVKVANAGTKALQAANNLATAYDVCKWYSVQANAAPVGGIVLYHGNFQQLWTEHQRITNLNKTITDPLQQWKFQGDFIQTPLPLNTDGTLNWNAATGVGQLNYLNFSRYDKKSWGLNNGYGMRW